MITRNVLLALKKEINELTKVIDVALLPISSKDKLFNTQYDYYEALKNENKVPQDFYKFQFFDFDLYLNYDLRQKKYFLCSDSKYLKIDCGSNFDDAKNMFLKNINDYICTHELQGALF